MGVGCISGRMESSMKDSGLMESNMDKALGKVRTIKVPNPYRSIRRKLCWRVERQQGQW
jgi:hypothetical protein